MHFSTGCDHCCWSSGYSIGLQFCSDLSCSVCALKLPNLPQIFFPLVSLRMPLVDTKHAEARRMKRVECGFVLFSELEKTFCHFPRVSAGALFLLQSLFLRPLLKFWSIRATPMNTGVLNRTMCGAKNHRHVDSECPLLLHATTPTTSSCSATALEKTLVGPKTCGVRATPMCSQIPSENVQERKCLHCLASSATTLTDSLSNNLNQT